MEKVERTKIELRGLNRVYNELLRHIPDSLGNPVRARFMENYANAFGERSLVSRGCRVLGMTNLAIGSGVTVARDVTLDARGGLTLADDALIGFESVLLTHTHDSDRFGVRIQDQGMYSDPIVIGDRAWLGTRTILLPGVNIGADAIVASGAVATRDVSPGAVVAGVPAKEISRRGATEHDVRGT
jgi:maltose O-acetyltransferase